MLMDTVYSCSSAGQHGSAREASGTLTRVPLGSTTSTATAGQSWLSWSARSRGRSLQFSLTCLLPKCYFSLTSNHVQIGVTRSTQFNLSSRAKPHSHYYNNYTRFEHAVSRTLKLQSPRVSALRSPWRQAREKPIRRSHVLQVNC